MDFDPFDVSTMPGIGFPAVVDHGSLWDGDLAAYRRMGIRIPTANEAFAKDWGITPQSRELDDRNQYTTPYSAAEVIRMVDIQRCVDIDPSAVVPTGVSYELVRLVVPEGQVGVLEQIPTMLDQVVALDAGGVPIFDFGSLNGERLCRQQLDHPDPIVTEPLTWKWTLLWTDASDIPGAAQQPTPYSGPVAPSAVQGVTIGRPWTDARMGSQNRWAQDQQYLCPAGSVARYWVTFQGPTNRFGIRVGARLQGFTQNGGRHGAALQNVLTRHH